ncbi:hypothetical protein Pst134EB_028278 [Puccinia striiformis f. sp. tritici]|nr:hypothetical protein Pst134EB_028278 [Puccinia striiformis f. sp. tritici]
MTIDNIDEYLFKEDWPEAKEVSKSTKRKRATGGTKTSVKKLKLGDPLADILAENLTIEFKRLFDLKYPYGTIMLPKHLFGRDKIDKIIENLNSITSVPELRKIIGGRLVPGQNEGLNNVIQEFKLGPLANEERVRIQLEEEKQAAETERKRVEKEAHDVEMARQQAITDEAIRIETEQREARLAIENCVKEDQREQLKILIRQAGEEAERRGVPSIHCGRYT